MSEKCPTCRAPVTHENDKYQFDSSRYHMDAVKKLSEISALRGEVEEYQQHEDEIIIALGSQGILPSEIVAEVKCLKAKLEWIPWNENAEHPRPHRDVLILYEYDSIHGHRGVHITEDSRMNTGKWESESDVTHWMPLPNPPESE